jgi:hypothetical protein
MVVLYGRAGRLTAPFRRFSSRAVLFLTEHAASAPVALHAHIIDIRGGELSVGTSTDPFMGLHASIVLHGDAYAWGGHKDKGCLSAVNPETLVAASALACAKIINVRGTFQAYGRPRQTIRRFAADAAQGDTQIVMSGAVDWEAGDSLVLTGHSGEPSQMNIWRQEFPHGDGRQVQAFKEIKTVHAVSEDGLVVTLTEPLGRHHVGSLVSQNGIQLDVRDTAALLTRNVFISAGNDPTLDMTSGVPMRETGYGFNIHVLGSDTEANGDNVPAGTAVLHNVAFEDAGKQYIYKCGLNDCAVSLAAVTGLNADVQGDASSRLPGDGVGLNDHAGVRAAGPGPPWAVKRP